MEATEACLTLLETATRSYQEQIRKLAESVKAQMHASISLTSAPNDGKRLVCSATVCACILDADVLDLVLFFLPLIKLLHLKCINKCWASAIRRCLTSTDWLFRGVTYTPYVFLPHNIEARAQAVAHFVNSPIFYDEDINALQMRALVNEKQEFKLPHPMIFETSHGPKRAFSERAILHDLQVAIEIDPEDGEYSVIVQTLRLEVAKYGLFTNLTQIWNHKAFNLGPIRPMSHALCYLKFVTYVGDVPFEVSDDRNMLNDERRSPRYATNLYDILCNRGNTVVRSNGESCVGNKGRGRP